MPTQPDSNTNTPPTNDWQFPGFTSPNYTPVPDEFFDVLAPHLAEAEMRVLLYVIRRTFGWKKQFDNISLKQMVEGITTRDGRVLDQGTGLSKPAVIRAVRSLASRKVIIATARQSRERGFEATTYSLNVVQNTAAGHPLLTKLTGGSKRSLHALVNEGNIQETVEQEIEEQETDLSNIRMASTLEESVQDNEATDSETPAHTDFEKVATTLEKQHPRAPQPYDQDRQAILAYIQDFAREFSDRASLKTSTTRAYNLYKRSGLSLEEFLSRLHESRSITKERTASIRSSTKEGQDYFPTKRKMAYFFAIVEDRLGLREESKLPRDKGISRGEDRNDSSTGVVRGQGAE